MPTRDAEQARAARDDVATLHGFAPDADDHTLPYRRNCHVMGHSNSGRRCPLRDHQPPRWLLVRAAAIAPFVLQNSFLGCVQIFPGALVRLLENYVGGHMNSLISNRPPL
jgi:hypothetical protein